MILADVLLLPAPYPGASFTLTVLLLVSASVVFVVVWTLLKPKR